MRKTFMDFKIISFRESPGGPVVRTLHFHCRGPGFHPCQGIKIPQAARCGQQNKTKQKFPFEFTVILLGVLKKKDKIIKNYCCLVTWLRREMEK